MLQNDILFGCLSESVNTKHTLMGNSFCSKSGHVLLRISAYYVTDLFP